jgi:hypothetical protein
MARFSGHDKRLRRQIFDRLRYFCSTEEVGNEARMLRIEFQNDLRSWRGLPIGEMKSNLRSYRPRINDLFRLYSERTGR